MYELFANYRQVIANNVKTYGETAQYAYHYTDVLNAINILCSDYLYSRNRALNKRLMANDNASNSVISNTCDEVREYVRFYFRPLTPTQYYNEGYKPFPLRIDEHANVPVPVFFVFDLEKLLHNPDVSFTTIGRAEKKSVPLLKGLDNFKKLCFRKIYSNGSYNPNIANLKQFRHAEIACLNELKIEPYFKKIIYRNQVEYLTLVSLLSEKCPTAWCKYSKYIGYCKNQNESTKYFNFNRVFISNIISNIIFNPNILNLSITLNDHNNKRKYYQQRYDDDSLKIKFSMYVNLNSCFPVIHEKTIDYIETKEIQLSFTPKKNYIFGSLVLKIYLDDVLMAYVSIPTQTSRS